MVKDEKEKEKNLDARYGTKTGIMFFKKIKAQINLREYIFRHLNIYEVLIFRLLCLLNNLDFVGQSHSHRFLQHKQDTFQSDCTKPEVRQTAWCTADNVGFT